MHLSRDGTFNQVVQGSSPCQPANNIKYLAADKILEILVIVQAQIRRTSKQTSPFLDHLLSHTHTVSLDEKLRPGAQTQLICVQRVKNLTPLIQVVHPLALPSLLP